jgi:bacillithiol system protein YtxJ
MAEIINLNSLEQWEDLKKDIKELLIFKYSPVCPISSVVDGDLESWVAALPEESKLICARLNVIESKEVSLKVAADLNIKHQSPQLIWLTGGLHVKWHGSHYDITKSKLTAVLNK